MMAVSLNYRIFNIAKMRPPTLLFDKGTIVVRGELRAPYTSYDSRVKGFRAQALYYREIIEYFERSRIVYTDRASDLVPCPELTSSLKLRGYQDESLKRWIEAGRRGIVVLPTGSGKTVIAIKAIELINEPSIVIVPTLDLVQQWKSRLCKEFNTEVGVCGGGDNTIQAITVSTYDSAYLRAGELGNRFSLIVFDECHHLPAEGYRQIAEMFISPYRLGLTATYEREDGLHRDLPRLVGGIVYRLKPDDLVGEYLADYTLQRISVPLTEYELTEYRTNYTVFKDYLRKIGIPQSDPQSLLKIIWRSNRDSEARKALLARNKALSISFNSESKIEALRMVLDEHPNERMIIFTQHNDLVHRISKEFLLPYITHRTQKEERADILQTFRDGGYRAIVTSRVLDEGIDVPEASLGVIWSGSGSSREFVQRLGRLLRKREGKMARLIEIISEQTSESRVSWRRKRRLKS
jgi:superfamily II DNA or RNA helicase